MSTPVLGLQIYAKFFNLQNKLQKFCDKITLSDSLPIFGFRGMLRISLKLREFPTFVLNVPGGQAEKILDAFPDFILPLYSMDVELLSRMIGELVIDHDKVGLPGVGTFVAEIVPASFSDRGYTINPPYRRLYFTEECLEDNLLVDFYASSNAVPTDAARVYLTQFLSEMKTVLMQRKTIILPSLGRLRATRENNFFFVANENLDIYPDGYALKPVSLKSLATDEEKTVVPFVFNPEQAAAAEKPAGVESLEETSLPTEPAEATVETPEPVAPEPETGDSTEQLVSETETAGVSESSETESASLTTPDSEPGIEGAAEPDSGGTPDETPEEPSPEPAEPTESTVETPEPAAPEPDSHEPTAPAEAEANSEIQETHEATAAESGTSEIPETPVAVPDKRKPKISESVHKTGKRRWWLIPLIILAVATVALAAFIILAHAAPDLVDSILYSPEELRIINY